MWKPTEDGGAEATSVFKVIPAITMMNVAKRYQVTMSDGNTYEGVFKGYRYKKQRPDSVQVHVTLRLQTSRGEMILNDLDVMRASKIG